MTTPNLSPKEKYCEVCKQKVDAGLCCLSCHRKFLSEQAKQHKAELDKQAKEKDKEFLEMFDGYNIYDDLTDEGKEEVDKYFSELRSRNG